MVKFKQIGSKLLNNYTLIMLAFSLSVLGITGVGNVLISSGLGLILCIICLSQSEFKADIAVLFLLVLYNLCNMLSSYMHTGSIIQGYAPLQGVIIIIYLVASSLSEEDIRKLHLFCIIWFTFASISGIIQVLLVPQGSMHRASGILNNPNALGITLVLGWFLLLNLNRFEQAEPIILAGLALTLSMGSFVSMAAGILFIIIHKIRQRELHRDVFRYTCDLLARDVIGMSAGIILYTAVSRTKLVWLGWLIFAYILMLAFYWKEICEFLSINKVISIVLTFAGVIVALATIILRPSAIATFAERIAMIKNGLGYVKIHPLVGVGPFQWRILNLSDSDKYFNTWHIHNVIVHAAVEFGLIAALTLIVLAVYIFNKCDNMYKNAALVSFICHNMIDTSFFYVGITSFLLVILCGSKIEKITSSNMRLLKAVILFFGVFFLYSLLKIPLG